MHLEYNRITIFSIFNTEAMKIQIEQSEKQLTLQDIADFEAAYKVNLPENYKRFIMKFNGGVTTSNDFFIHDLYSIKYGENTLEEVIEMLQIDEQNIPREYLPFANNGTGLEITLYLKEDDNLGKIFVFRYDQDEPEKIADSLEELFEITDMDELDNNAIA
jgi:cell wall assembly regulator SMI1